MSCVFQRSKVSPKHGFTLIELMVVVFMIGIMVAMVIPEMRGTLNDAVLRATARKLVIAMDLAHSQAITIGSPHRLRLDLKRSRFVVERKSTEEDRTHGFIPAREAPGSEGELDPRISIRVNHNGDESSEATDSMELEPAPKETAASGTRESISFESDGTAESAEFVLRDPQGFGLTLRINPITARVRIMDRPHE